MSYSITDWRERYEVSDKGHPAREGDTLRRGPLEYIRAPVHGKSWSLSFREFNRVFGADAPAAYGLFCKLRELQADNPAPLRDCIRDHKGREMSAEDIAAVLGWPEKLVVRLLGLLASEAVAWIVAPNQPNTDQNNTTQAAGKFPANPGDSQKKRETPLNPDFDAFWVAYPKKEAKADAEKAFGQVEGSKHIKDILAALSWQIKLEKWTKDKGQFVPLPATYLRGRRWTDVKPGYGSSITARPADPTVTFQARMQAKYGVYVIGMHEQEYAEHFDPSNHAANQRKVAEQARAAPNIIRQAFGK